MAPAGLFFLADFVQERADPSVHDRGLPVMPEPPHAPGGQEDDGKDDQPRFPSARHGRPFPVSIIPPPPRGRKTVGKPRPGCVVAGRRAEDRGSYGMRRQRQRFGSMAAERRATQANHGSHRGAGGAARVWRSCGTKRSIGQRPNGGTGCFLVLFGRRYPRQVLVAREGGARGVRTCSRGRGGLSPRGFRRSGRNTSASSASIARRPVPSGCSPTSTARSRSRLPSSGIKTDDNDLAANHRAAVNGFALAEPPSDPLWQKFQLILRHRRDLVQKASTLRGQIKEHLQAAMPGYAECFPRLWATPTR